MVAARQKSLHCGSRRLAHHPVMRQSAVVIASQGAKFHGIALAGILGPRIFSHHSSTVVRMLSRIVLTSCKRSSSLPLTCEGSGNGQLNRVVTPGKIGHPFPSDSAQTAMTY